VTLEDKPVADRTVPITKGTSAGLSRAYGPGLEEGDTARPAAFTIQAVGPDGKDKSNGGDAFVVQVKGPKGVVPHQMVDNRDGTYGVVYNPKDVGEHVVKIDLKDQAVAKSPYRVPVVEGTDAAQTKVYGPGVDGVPSTRKPAVFTIQSVNKAGVPKKKGGDVFEATVKGPQDLPVTVVDNGNGTYTATYVPEVAGDYIVDVKLGPDSVGQCPKRVRVKETTDINNSGISGATVTIAMVLANKQRKVTGGDTVTCTGSCGGAACVVNVVDVGDGTYQLNLPVATRGQYSLNVSINGKTPTWSPLIATF